jgi:spermidine synthase
MARPADRTATTDRTAPAGAGANQKSSATEAPRPAGGDFLSLSTRLKVLVFWAGAVLMGLEIAGSRVLAPHFGNSIFVWGSLITVFLAALSAGYFLGGWLADKHPSHLLLSTICIAVSLWIVALSFFAYAFCAGMVGSGFGEKSGPLLASLVLFLPPSIGMGVVSPFAIRLSASSLSSLGKISGSLYALSTLGSIAGTMLTTFVLIPVTGVSIILRGLGISLLLVSLLILPTLKKAGSVAGIAGAVLILVVLLVAPFDTGLELALGQRLTYEIGTPYHNIAVIDTPRNGVRELRFDRFTESGISTVPPYSSYGYTNYFNLAFLLKPDIRHALFIGAGGGIGPRAFHMHQPNMQIDVVDIDPKVLEVARNYFFVEDTPNIKLTAEDGRMFVKNTSDHYDCILLDAFTIGGRIPFHLVTKEFFTLCRERMVDEGVFVMNINSALTGPLANIFRSVDRTLEEVFPGRVSVFAVDEGGRADSSQSMNIIFVATKGGPRLSPGQWHTKVAEYASASYVGPQRMAQMVGDIVTEVPDVSAAPVFTDEYAPIETMAF